MEESSNFPSFLYSSPLLSTLLFPSIHSPYRPSSLHYFTLICSSLLLLLFSNFSALLFSTLLFFTLPHPSKLHPGNSRSNLPFMIETGLLKILLTQAEGGQTLMLLSFFIPALCFSCSDTCSKRAKITNKKDTY